MCVKLFLKDLNSDYCLLHSTRVRGGSYFKLIKFDYCQVLSNVTYAINGEDI